MCPTLEKDGFAVRTETGRRHTKRREENVQEIEEREMKREAQRPPLILGIETSKI